MSDGKNVRAVTSSGKVLIFPPNTPDEVVDRAVMDHVKGMETTKSPWTVIADTPNGGKVFRSDSGKLSFSDGNYATSDPEKIAEIMEGATAADTSMASFDKTTLDQSGMGAGIANEFVRGAGLALGSRSDELAGAVFGDDIKQGMRATSSAMNRQYPKTSIAANVAGGIGTTGAALAAAPFAPAAVGQAAATMTRMLAPNVGRVGLQALRSGAIGATAGGIGGGVFGSGEGTDPESRIEKGKSGAAFGAIGGGVLSPLMPIAARGGKNIMDYVKKNDVLKIASFLNISKGAANVIKKTFERGGDMDAAIANVTRAGDQGMLVDAGNAAQALADGAMAAGGEASTTIGNAINRRATDSVAQLDAGLNSVLGADALGPVSAVKAIAEKTREARKEAYGAAYSTPIDYASATGRNIDGVISRIQPKVLMDAIEEANADMRANSLTNQQVMASISDSGEVVFTNPPNVQQLDYLKRSLNTLSENARGEFGKQTAASLRFGMLARDLRAAIGDAVVDPDTGRRVYDDAVQLGGETIREQNAFKLGRDALKPKTEIEDVIEELGLDPSDAQIEAAKQGMRSAIRTKLGNVRAVPSDPDIAARQIDEFVRMVSSDNARGKIKQILGDEAPALLKELDEASQTALVRSALNINSKTAIRRAISDDVDALSGTGPLASALRGKPVNTTQEVIQIVTGQTADFDADQRQLVFEEIARALTDRRGKSAVAALDYIKKAMEGQRITGPQREFVARQVTLAIGGGSIGKAGQAANAQ